MAQGTQSGALTAWMGGWGGREVWGGGTHTHLWQTHAGVWQRPTQHCRAVILQLKVSVSKKGY